MFLKRSVMEKKLSITGSVSRFSDKSFLSHSAGKKLRGTLLCSNEFLVMTTIMHMKWASQFCRFFFVSQYRKKFVGRTVRFQKCSGMEQKP